MISLYVLCNVAVCQNESSGAKSIVVTISTDEWVILRASFASGQGIELN